MSHARQVTPETRHRRCPVDNLAMQIKSASLAVVRESSRLDRITSTKRELLPPERPRHVEWGERHVALIDFGDWYFKPLRMFRDMSSALTGDLGLPGERL